MTDFSSQYSSYLADIYACVCNITSGNLVLLDIFLSDALLSKLIGGFSLSLPHHFLQCFRNLDISPSLHLSFSDVCQAVTVTKGRGAVPSRLPCEIEEDHILIRTFMSSVFFSCSP